MTLRLLHCERGNHSWEVPARRGRYPKNCPEHVVTPAKPETDETPAVKAEAGVRRVIERVLADPRSEGCACGITADFTRDDLNTLGAGCTAPRYVCPTLDRINRGIGFRPEVIYEDDE